jgi:RNA polymerase sigma factor (sigma-70 family)
MDEPCGADRVLMGNDARVDSSRSGYEALRMRAASIPADAAVPRRIAPKRLLALAGDERLVEHIRRGDERAFEVAFERHSPAILAFCRHMLGSREEAEDAVQHTFAAAFRDLQRDGARDIALKPWLFAIARNRSISILRGRRELPIEEPVLPAAGPAEQVEQRAELRRVLDDVRELPDDQRAALLLAELGDLSHAEVATVLGCEVPRVKALVYRARSALIARREARATPCDQIREQLANLRGGSLRRTELRLHLRECPGCRAFRDEVKQQRKLLAAALPVAPSLGLKSSVLAAVGIGGGSAGGGATAAGLAGIGGAFGGGATAKVAVVAAVAGAGVVGGAAVVERGSPVSPGAPEGAGVDGGGVGNEGSDAAGRGVGRFMYRDGVIKRHTPLETGAAGRGPGHARPGDPGARGRAGAPGQANVPPGQAKGDRGAPGMSKAAPGQRGASGRSNEAPGERGAAGRTRSAPGERGASGRSNAAPGDRGASPRVRTAPGDRAGSGRSTAPPRKRAAPRKLTTPGKTRAPSGRAEPPPGRPTAPPGRAEAAPGQAEPAPGPPEEPSADAGAPPSHSGAPR